MGQEPNYVHDPVESKNLDYFTITTADAFNPQAKINRIVVAVDVAPDGEQYVLTFGNGIKKVGANGGYIDFIPNTNDRLSNAMDFAINSDGKFFVATNESNRRFIRVYSPTGIYLPTETLGNGDYGTGADEFKGPSGLTFDSNDNMYVADHYLGDADPPPARPSSIKIYKKDAAGNYKNNLLREFDNVNGTVLNFPYRIALNSSGQLYLSELGQDNDAKVKIIDFDSNFIPIGIIEGPSANLGAPGSIIIDKFDYIFVADFGNEIDLPRLLAATGDLEEFYAVFEIIKEGIKNDVFNINIYNPDNSFRSIISSEIDFPIDFAVSECGTLYVDNAIFDGEIRNFFGIPVPDVSMDFDLEAYQRSAGFDTEIPVLVSCLENREEELTSGTFILQDYRTLSEFSDNCDDNLDLVQDPPAGTSITENTVVAIVAKDDSGNESEECTFTVIVKESADTTAPTFTICEDQIFSSDLGKCGAIVSYTIPEATDNSGEDPILKRTAGPASGEFFPVGTTTVTYTATDSTENIAECSFTITVTDIEAPTFSDCPEIITAAFEVTEGFKVEDYSTFFPATDNCTGDISYSQSPAPGTIIFSGGDHPVVLTATDPAENVDSCEFILQLTEMNSLSLNCNREIRVAANDECKFILPDLSEEFTYFPEEAQIEQSIATGDILTNDTEVLITATYGERTETCTIKVKLVDYSWPELICPTIQNVTVTSSDGFTLPNYINQIEANDNCGIVKIVQEPAPGTVVTEDVTVKITAEDTFGNLQDCFIYVYLQEEEKPLQISCPQDQTIDPEGECNAALPDYRDLASVTDGARLVQVPPRGTTFFQSTTVTLTAYLNDEEISCSFDVQIINLPNLSIACPEDFIAEPDENGFYTLEDYPVDIIEGWCGLGMNKTQNPPAGTAITEDTEVTIIVTDEAESVAECTFTVYIDSAPPPEVKCLSPTISLKEDGAVSLDPEQIFDGDADHPSIDHLSVDRPSFSCADIGVQSVRLTVHFLDGTSEICNTKVTVVDEIDPEIYCIAPGKEYALVNGSVTIDVYDLVGQRSDNCGNPEVWLSQDTFTSPGTKTITINAEDASGNKDSCTTTIEVVQASTTPGSCKPVTLFLDASGNATLEPEEVFAGDPDDPAIVNMELDRENFTCEDLGEPVQVNLIIHYTDGSSSTCSALVTVEDNIAPQIVCVEEFTLHLNEAGVGRITPEIFDRGSSDNCGFLMSLSKENFDLDDVGEQEVILTATDASGKISTCTTIVTVEAYNEERPGVSCVEKLTLPLSQAGDFFLQLNYTGNEANEEYTLSKESFSCEDLGTQYITVTYWGEYTGTCLIEITVVDDSPPVITCLEEIDVQLDASGNATVSVEELDLEFSDNCSVAGTSLSRTNFTTADIGETEITFTVIDGSGKESVCTTTVNVLPFNSGEPEAIQCVDLHVIQIGEDGRAILNPRDLFSGGTGTAQFEVSKDTFTCLDLGENTVILNYSTPAGEGSCEVTVIVEDPSGYCGEPVDPSNGDYIILYPNPSLGIVRFQTSPGLEIHRVEVFDMRGRYLFEKIYDQNTIFDKKLDLQEYQSGVYSILIFTNGKEYLKRAIIRN